MTDGFRHFGRSLLAAVLLTVVGVGCASEPSYSDVTFAGQGNLFRYTTNEGGLPYVGVVVTRGGPLSYSYTVEGDGTITGELQESERISRIGPITDVQLEWIGDGAAIISLNPMQPLPEPSVEQDVP